MSYKKPYNHIPVIVTIPCFSGAPWDVEMLEPLLQTNTQTMALPNIEATNIEVYADFVEDRIKHLEDYVLVGDSFGAIIALAVAVRQPKGLRALVMSGGFAADPISSPLLRLRLKLGQFLPGFLYRFVTLWFHALALRSRYDKTGNQKWSVQKSWRLFAEHTPHKSYTTRAKAAFSADYTPQLSLVKVPTLIITPADDKLIGKSAAETMHQGIANSQEVVLPSTGHMFRFSHPTTYANAIVKFLKNEGLHNE